MKCVSSSSVKFVFVAGSHRAGRRTSIFGRVAIPVALLLISYALGTGISHGATAAPSCTAQQVSNQTASLAAPLTAGRVAALANASAEYGAAIASLTPGAVVDYLGVSQLSHVDSSTCAIQLQSLNANYELLSPSGAAQLIISESPDSGQVINSSLLMSSQGVNTYSTGQWSGWTVNNCDGSCAVEGTYAQWQGFDLGVPTNECGASTTIDGLCSISIWAGLTASYGGGGNPQGIAQSGVTISEACEWSVLVYYCTPGTTAWFQFYPQMQYSSDCFESFSPSNEIVSEVSWESPNVYFAQIWDVTTGQDCSPYEETTMAMGTPYYGQFQSESVSNGIGGALDIPDFNVWYNPAVAIGESADLLDDHPTLWDDISGVLVSNPITYDQTPCAGTDESCFEESY